MTRGWIRSQRCQGIAPPRTRRPVGVFVGREQFQLALPGLPGGLASWPGSESTAMLRRDGEQPRPAAGRPSPRMRHARTNRFLHEVSSRCLSPPVGGGKAKQGTAVLGV